MATLFLLLIVGFFETRLFSFASIAVVILHLLPNKKYY